MKQDFCTNILKELKKNRKTDSWRGEIIGKPKELSKTKTDFFFFAMDQ